jgi:hypothetical protein
MDGARRPSDDEAGLVRAGPRVTTLALAERGPLLRQEVVGGSWRAWMVFVASFAGGWALSLVERGMPAALPLLDSLALTVGAAAVARLTFGELHRTRDARALAAAPIGLDLREGARTRLRGEVELIAAVTPEEPAPPHAPGWSAALAFYVGRIGAFGSLFTRFVRPMTELRGRNFRLVLPTGARVLVDVTHARYLSDHPLIAEPRFRGRPLWTRVEDEEKGVVVFVYAEDLVGPGDTIDVLGVLTREVDPAGAAASDRGARLGMRIAGTAERPLLLRKVARRR